MKKTLLTSIAALFLATGAAHAHAEFVSSLKDCLTNLTDDAAVKTCQKRYGKRYVRAACEAFEQAIQKTEQCRKEGYSGCGDPSDASESLVAMCVPKPGAIDEWKGAWQDCSSHNIPGRGACVGRPCEGNWPGPSDQCSAKAQSNRWLKRAEKQRERCRRYLDDTPTYKQIIRFDRCMQAWRKRNRLGR